MNHPGGVTIMNTAYLTKECQHDPIKRANKEYQEVMLDENSEGYVLSDDRLIIP
jgi:hypothetical protein